MSPHKPSPLPREVEVDLSAILVRAEEFNRPGLTYESPNAFLIGSKDRSSSGHFPRLGSSVCANLIFAVGASLIGIFCTLSTFDDLEQFRRTSHSSAAAVRARPELGAIDGQRFVSNEPRRPTTTRLIETNVGFPKEESFFSNPVPLSALSPIFGNDISPLLSNSDRIAENSSSSGRSISSGRTSMSEEATSNLKGANAVQQTASRQPHSRNLMQHARRSIVSSTKTSTSRQDDLGNRFLNASHQLTIDKSGLQSARSMRTGSGQAAMSMRSGVETMQDRAGLNGMRMQHGILAQSPAVGGLNVGLNGAGLGGANARR